MGAAAYNRGSKRISADTSAAARAVEFADMADWNAMPKHPQASRPFAPIIFRHDRHRELWWALDAVKQERGFGFCFQSRRDAITAFQVTITGMIGLDIHAEPSSTQAIDTHRGQVA